MEQFSPIDAQLRSLSDLTPDHVVAGFNWLVCMCEPDHWNLSDEQIAMMLGLMGPDIYVSLKQKLKDKSPIEINESILERISLLLGIWKNLRLIVPEDRQDLAYQLFDRPSSQLDGKSIKKYLLEHKDIGAFYSVNRILSGMHC